MSDTAAQNIFIVGPSWVGDMVMAQSLFQTLAARHPDTQIDVLAPAWARPILARMPEVRHSIDMPVGHGKLQLGERRRLGYSLRAAAYDQAIVLPNSLKSALIPAFAGIPKRTGWRGEMRFGLLNDIRKLDKQRYPLMVERFVALAYEPGATLPPELGIPALRVDKDNQLSLRQRLGLDSAAPLLGLCPGAEFGPAKRWPERHYAALASHYINQGWQVLLLGSQNDAPVAQSIIAAVDESARVRCINAAGTTSLVDAVDLLASCSLVVSNDSGLMHVAAAVGAPLAAVYGSTSPAFTPPLGEDVSIVSHELPCRPCFKRECPLGHLDCLNKLPAVEVIEAADALLGQTTDSSA